MTYLLDTDTCIYWLKGIQPIRGNLEAAGQSQVAVSTITVAELYFGAYNSSQVAHNLARAEMFARQISVLGLGDETLKTFGRVKSDLRKQGQPLPDFDLLIAATAIAEGRVLVTNNTRHYARLPGLQLENWLTNSTS